MTIPPEVVEAAWCIQRTATYDEHKQASDTILAYWEGLDGVTLAALILAAAEAEALKAITRRVATCGYTPEEGRDAINAICEIDAVTGVNSGEYGDSVRAVERLLARALPADVPLDRVTYECGCVFPVPVGWTTWDRCLHHDAPMKERTADGAR